MSETPTVLVTGAAKRLGRAIAQGFGKRGWHVIVHYGQSAREAETLAASLPSAETYGCDLADLNSCDWMIDRLAGAHPAFQALVNCAGIFEADTAETLDPAMLLCAIEVNALAPARLAQRFFARSQAPQRRVIQITDQKIRNTNPNFFSYTMSKHALHATVGMLAKAHAAPQNAVYGLAPGAVLASHDQSEAEAARSHTRNLLKRRTTVNDIARAAVFLAQGHLASGQTLYVDGGQHLLNQPRDVIFLEREERE